VVQRDRESVAVRRFDTRCRLRYALLIGGQYLRATSVVLATEAGDHDSAEVTAHFITATITDRIRPTEDGFEVLRRWSVIPTLAIALLFTVEVEAEQTATVASATLNTSGRASADAANFISYVAPGCCAGRVGTETKCGVTTDELASPLAALHSRDWSIAIASEGDHLHGRESLAIRAVHDGAPATATVAGARVDFRLPAAVAAARPEAETPVEGEDWLAAVAGRVVERRYRATITAPGALTHHICRRWFVPQEEADRPSRSEFAERLQRALATVLESHLLEQGPVCGLRVHADNGNKGAIAWLSASASVGVAAAILASADASGSARHETARRMIDFALRGQHPSGIFYERYDVERRVWRGLDRRSNPPRIALVDGCRTSRYLRLAAQALQPDAVAERLRLAWQRFVSGFVAAGRLTGAGAVLTPDRVVIEPGMDALALVGELDALAASGYRPPGVRSMSKLPALVMALVQEHVAGSSRDGELPTARRGEPSSAAALSVVEALLALPDADKGHAAWQRSAGYGAAANLLSWIANANRGHGGLVDSVQRPRLLSTGNRVAFALMQLANLAAERDEMELASLYRATATAALQFSLRMPLGTGYLLAGSSTPEPVDARVLASEVMFGGRLLRDYEALFGD